MPYDFRRTPPAGAVCSWGGHPVTILGYVRALELLYGREEILATSHALTGEDHDECFRSNGRAEILDTLRRLVEDRVVPPDEIKREFAEQLDIDSCLPQLRFVDFEMISESSASSGEDFRYLGYLVDASDDLDVVRAPDVQVELLFRLQIVVKGILKEVEGGYPIGSLCCVPCSDCGMRRQATIQVALP